MDTSVYVSYYGCMGMWVYGSVCLGVYAYVYVFSRSVKGVGVGVRVRVRLRVGYGRMRVWGYICVGV